MNIGKVPGSVLKRSVVNLIGKGPRTGVDAAILGSRGDITTLAATGVGICDSSIAPMLAVFKACNNIWAAGGEVSGVEASFVISDRQKERELKKLTRATLTATRLCHTELVGGHTEVSDAVIRTISTVTAIGSAKGKVSSVKDIRAGMGIVMTKWAGLEEAAICINNGETHKMLTERFSPYYMSCFEDYTEWLTVFEEARLAKEFGDVIMHDNSDGGVFGSLWDLAEGSGLGFEVNLRDIPIRQEIIELAYLCGLNIYRMKSSGSLLIVADKAEELAEHITNNGIPAAYIGCFTDNNDKIIRVDDEIRYLERV